MDDVPDNLCENEDVVVRTRAGLFSKKEDDKANKNTAEVVQAVHEDVAVRHRAGLFSKKEDDKANENTAEVVQAVHEDIGKPLANRFYRKSRGLIICNTFKGTSSPLLGYKKDVENIKETFKELNISFDVERNLNVQKMTNVAHFWLKDTEFKDADCTICFILSHGDDNGVIYGADEKKMKLDDIKTKFINSEKLIGKPKLFFVQACRGLKDAEAVVVPNIRTAGAEEPKCKEADVFQFFSTSPGKVAWVGSTGSLFITTLCNVVRAYGGKYHLGDIVTKVNEKLAYNVSKFKENGDYSTAVEVSEAHSTLTYNVYFNDGSTEWL